MWVSLLDTRAIRCNPVAKRKEQHVVIDVDEPAHDIDPGLNRELERWWAKRGTPREQSHARRWYVALDSLLKPLTRDVQKEVGSILTTPQTTQLLKDWDEIADVAWWYAVSRHLDDTHRRDTQRERYKEVQAARAAKRALLPITRQLETFLKHTGELRTTEWPYPAAMQDSPDAFVALTKAQLEIQAEKLYSFLRQERNNPSSTTPGKLGQPPQAKTYLMEVLLAYFRHRQWPVRIPLTNHSKHNTRASWEPHFVRIALVLCFGDSHQKRRKSYERPVIPAPTRKRLQDSGVTWEDLTAVASTRTPQQKARRSPKNPLGL
jgi:hypothetical protein